MQIMLNEHARGAENRRDLLTPHCIMVYACLISPNFFVVFFFCKTEF